MAGALPALPPFECSLIRQQSSQWNPYSGLCLCLDGAGACVSTQEEGMPFLQQLQAEAMRNADDPINEMMQRMCAPLIPPALLRTAAACEMTLACHVRRRLPLPFPSDKTIPSHNGQHPHTVSELKPDLVIVLSTGHSMTMGRTHTHTRSIRAEA